MMMPSIFGENLIDDLFDLIIRLEDIKERTTH